MPTETKLFKLDSENFISIMNERFANGCDIVLNVTGSSMVPFLAENRDSICLSPVNGELSEGDIVFYKRKNSKCVLHRIVKIKEDGYFFCGDAQTAVEGPLDRDCFLAVCRSVTRKGKSVNEKSFIWFFFRHIWRIALPVRPKILSLISKVKNLTKRKSNDNTNL